MFASKEMKKPVQNTISKVNKNNTQKLKQPDNLTTYPHQFLQYSVGKRALQPPPTRLQRQCPRQEDSLKLQRQIVRDQGAFEAPPLVHEVLRSSGQPLDKQTRDFMEPRFGYDFGHVRVHTDAKAAESAQAVNARAYTVGHHVVMRQGEYAPTTETGRRLLAHELVHVVQQGSGERLQKLSVGAVGDVYEREAERVTDRVMGMSPPDRRWVSLRSRYHEKTLHVVQRQSPKTPAKTRVNQGPIFKLDKKPSACACLVHVHNNERNAKVVANFMQDNCKYNLAQVFPDNKARKVKTPTGKNDPNEFFNSEVIKNHCKPDIYNCDPKLSTVPSNNNDKITWQFFQTLRECSNNFSIPVIALHNDDISDTPIYLKSLGDQKKKLLLSSEKQKKRKNKPKRTSTARLFGTGKTNIFNWCMSPAIKKCFIGDKAKPDYLIWTSDKKDFLKLTKVLDVNVVLQHEKFFGDNDLSTLFNVFNPLYPLTPKNPRYINIETPHKPGKLSTPETIDNFMFVTNTLKKLGYFCCNKKLEQLYNAKDKTALIKEFNKIK